MGQPYYFGTCVSGNFGLQFILFTSYVANRSYARQCSD